MVNKARLNRTSLSDSSSCSIGVADCPAFSNSAEYAVFTVEAHARKMYFHRSQLSRLSSNNGGLGMFLGSTKRESPMLVAACELAVASALTLPNSLRVSVKATLCCSNAVCALCKAAFSVVCCDLNCSFHYFERKNKRTKTTTQVTCSSSDL